MLAILILWNTEWVKDRPTGSNISLPKSEKTLSYPKDQNQVVKPQKYHDFPGKTELLLKHPLQDRFFYQISPNPEKHKPMEKINGHVSRPNRLSNSTLQKRSVNNRYETCLKRPKKLSASGLPQPAAPNSTESSHTPSLKTSKTFFSTNTIKRPTSKTQNKHKNP